MENILGKEIRKDRFLFFEDFDILILVILMLLTFFLKSLIVPLFFTSNIIQWLLALIPISFFSFIKFLSIGKHKGYLSCLFFNLLGIKKIKLINENS